MNHWTNRILWAIYLALLAVLLPHTAWAFGQFEPAGQEWWGWLAALSFEGAIAVFTWRLKQAIERARGSAKWYLRWRRRYVNWYALGLLVGIGVSGLANWAHAVEFGQTFAVFGTYSVHPNLYAVAFGGMLPVCSLLFARILADVQSTEHEEDEALTQANKTIRRLNADLKRAEQRFEAVGDLIVILTAEQKRDRIQAARQRWPELTTRAIATIADASPAYVSEVTKDEPQDR